MVKKLLFCTFAGLAFASGTAWAADSRGELAGKVVEQANGQEKPVPNAVVRLRIFHNQKEVAGAETKADNTGNYRFVDLDTDPANFYVTGTERGGVPFRSNGDRFHRSKSLQMADLVIYPVRPDPGDIRGNEIILLEFGRRNVIKASHSVELRNEGTTPYDPRGERGTPIDLTLPKGGFELNLMGSLSQENTRVDEATSKLHLRLPIAPGPSGAVKVEYSYLFPYEHRSVSFDFPMSVSRDKLTLVLSEKDYRIRSALLTRQSPQTIKGKSYYFYTSGPVGPNEATSLTVSGLPMPGDVASGLLYSGLGAVLVAAIYFAVRPSRTPIAPKESEQAKKQGLAALTELERKFQGGSISSAQYHSEKERWLELLFDLQQEERAKPAA